MLVAGTHLLPDLTGALAWPKERVLALSDPVGGPEPRTWPAQASEAVKRLAALLRQRRPRAVVWLGSALPALLAEGRLARRDLGELARMAAEVEFHWIGEALPDGLPGQAADHLTMGKLTFRHRGDPQAMGEISASPWPVARFEDNTWPCFAVNAQRLVLPAFGLRPDGINVASLHFRPLFRKPFQAVMLANGRILTKPRAKLEVG